MNGTTKIKRIEFEFDPADKSLGNVYKKIINELGESFLKKLCIDFFLELKKNTKDGQPLIPDNDPNFNLDKLREVFAANGVNRELCSIVHFMYRNQIDNQSMNLAWKWFSAEKLSPQEQNKIGIIRDNTNDAVLSNILAEIFTMNHVAYKGTSLIVIFGDEVHQIEELPNKEGITALLRKLLELQSCSLVLAATTDNVSELTFMQEAIRRRFTIAGFNGLIELPEFDEPTDEINEIRQYVVELLELLRPPDWSFSNLSQNQKDEDGKPLSEDIFPFTEKALEAIPQWCKTAYDTEYPLFPGRISDGLTYALQMARDANKAIIDEDCFIENPAP